VSYKKQQVSGRGKKKLLLLMTLLDGLLLLGYRSAAQQRA
jgi:hypothetical protein